MLEPEEGCHALQLPHTQADHGAAHRHRSPCQPPPAAWHPACRRGPTPWWTGTSPRAGPASRGGPAATPGACQPRAPWQQAPAARLPPRTGAPTSSGPAAACPWCLAARSPSQVREGPLRLQLHISCLRPALLRVWRLCSPCSTLTGAVGARAEGASVHVLSAGHEPALKGKDPAWEAVRTGWRATPCEFLGPW